MRVVIIIVGVIVLFLLATRGDIYSAYNETQEYTIPQQDYKA